MESGKIFRCWLRFAILLDSVWEIRCGFDKIRSKIFTLRIYAVTDTIMVILPFCPRDIPAVDAIAHKSGPSPYPLSIRDLVPGLAEKCRFRDVLIDFRRFQKKSQPTYISEAIDFWNNNRYEIFAKHFHFRIYFDHHPGDTQQE